MKGRVRVSPSRVTRDGTATSYMKELNTKIIKRHQLKTYEFWQLDEKFLILAPDRRLLDLEGLEALPETGTGYLAYAFLDEEIKVAFLGLADPGEGTYQFFEEEEILLVPAQLLAQVLVHLVKPTEELTSHPFVDGVLALHRSEALTRSSLALRSLDYLRDPLYPQILTACFIRDEVRKEKVYEEELDLYRRALEAIISDEKGNLTERLEQLEMPLIPEDYINFVRIRDLQPANHGTWRAILLDNLPGTRLKRKGDPVALSLVTVTDEEASRTMLFINHTAPVEGTAIKVASYKPSRLPWRLAYELTCGDCPFEETFHLGRHGEDSYLFKEILNEIRAGRIDPLILIDLVQRDDCELDFSRELYRCRNCGTLAVMNQLRLITPDRTLSAAYSCPRCGERMSLVKRGHIASLDCPDCRKPLNLVSEKQWSGVPETEVEA